MKNKKLEKSRLNKEKKEKYIKNLQAKNKKLLKEKK